jgi:EpsD family peptidyl-prolyl cis-trans isomerase
MKSLTTKLMVPMVVVGLSSCGGGSEPGSKAPQGQVIARVAGEEITQRELTLELRNLQMTDPEAMRAAERTALAAIVNRKMFAKAAREQKLDDQAEFQLSQRRAEEVLLAQAYQSQVAAKIPRPTRDDAEKYIAAHPNSFGERKFYIVDQIQFELGSNRKKLDSFQSLRSMEDVEAKLLNEGIEYRRVPNSIDARSMPPKVVDQIAKLPKGDVFLLPGPNMVLVNTIREERIIPFTGEAAITHAQQLIMSERINKAMSAEVDALRKKAGNVTYQKGYGPPEAGGPPSNSPAPGSRDAPVPAKPRPIESENANPA